MGKQRFILLGNLLLEDDEKVKKLKTIYKREMEYASILGPVEQAIADFYFENRKIKDSDVVRIVKRIKSGYNNDLESFNHPLEREIMINLSYSLQRKKVTKHELILVLKYILWCIDNRKWMGHPRAYLDWLLNFFGMLDEAGKEKFDKFYENLKGEHSLTDAEISTMTHCSDNPNITEEDEEWSRTDSILCGLTDREKYDYFLECEDEPAFEFFEFCEKLIEEKKFDKAETLYKKIKEKYPKNPAGHISLGQLYLKMKEFTLTESNLENAIAILKKLQEEHPDRVDKRIIPHVEKMLEKARNKGRKHAKEQNT